MKVSEAQKLLTKVEGQLETLREKRKAQRLEYERGLVSGNAGYRAGDPQAPFRKTDADIARLEVKRQQLAESLAKAGVGGEVGDEETSADSSEAPGAETSQAQGGEEGSTEDDAPSSSTPTGRKRA